MKNRKEIIVVGIVVLVVFCAWYVSSLREHKKVRPSGPNVHFARFESEMSVPERIGFFRHDGKKYLEWKGRRMGGFTLPSGQPSYVFDETGHLVDWTPDNGDDAAYLERWGGFQNWQTTTIADAEQEWPQLSGPDRDTPSD